MSRNRFLPRARDARGHSGVGPRKRLSQNFLVDAGTARLLVHASGVGPEDLVLEIGPGAGMLTRRLAAAAGRVLAYEIDPRYAALLRKRYAGDATVRCFQADFRSVTPPREPFAVVANIPYASTTDIVRWCLAARHMTSATLLTQREFARKHSGDYGRWSKLAVTHWPTTEFAIGPRVDRTRFRPVPRVDSAVLHLRNRSRPLIAKDALPCYRRLVELGFSGVGGSLAASLATELPARRVRAACRSAGVPADEPVGTVDPDRWIALYKSLS
ncbi:23S ribosomal RNA methyltransferase Erm [Nocardia amikacinitolerans]|uniref:23S ribosomal RNA methyltransferase Erm n=1 Tax=Nocardia amikacinitolerans TaxID=756689 RepID=UPI0020A39653|nr:23S ribosomal RNA methyltransferase Erm [Nocardia amikacinitolerans]MCP2289472.1 23S rRNA (adenine-N6)-dimethyltransferase [Nocardia amikacinitolerans]